jgi:hypothetical protein
MRFAGRPVGPPAKAIASLADHASDAAVVIRGWLGRPHLVHDEGTRHENECAIDEVVIVEDIAATVTRDSSCGAPSWCLWGMSI